MELLAVDRDVGASLVIKDEDLDALVRVGHVPNPLGIDAAVGGGVVRKADGAAGALAAQRTLDILDELGAVLLGGRDFAQIVVAVDTDGVLGVVARAVVLVGTAASYGDKLAGRSFAVRILFGGETGGTSSYLF